MICRPRRRRRRKNYEQDGGGIGKKTGSNNSLATLDLGKGSRWIGKDPRAVGVLGMVLVTFFFL